MSRVPIDHPITPSIIDRIIDPEAGGTRFRRGYSLEKMIESVRRDLEDLLNTRRGISEIEEEYVELRNSIVNFGMPDFASLDTTTFQDRERLADVIEHIVEQFEPRLKEVRAVMDTSWDSGKFDVRYQIEAKLSVDPAPEVTFETVLELTTGHARVSAAEE